MSQYCELALRDLASVQREDRERGARLACSLFVNSSGRWDLKLAEKLLPGLLSRAKIDPVAIAPLATAAQCLWGAEAYPEALSCIEATMNYAAPMALSTKGPPWRDQDMPFTRQREIALHRLWRLECLFALNRVEDAKRSEHEAIAEAEDCLPPHFGLTSSTFYEYGTVKDFCSCARVRGARALRLKSMGRDANAFRRMPKKALSLGGGEAIRLRATARLLLDEAVHYVAPSLGEFFRFTTGKSSLSLEDRRRLGKWRGECYAEMGLLARDDGDAAEAARALAVAHWVFAVVESNFDVGGPGEYLEAIRALAPVPECTLNHTS